VLVAVFSSSCPSSRFGSSQDCGCFFSLPPFQVMNIITGVNLPPLPLLRDRLLAPPFQWILSQLPFFVTYFRLPCIDVSLNFISAVLKTTPFLFDFYSDLSYRFSFAKVEANGYCLHPFSSHWRSPPHPLFFLYINRGFAPSFDPTQTSSSLVLILFPFV